MLRIFLLLLLPVAVFAQQDPQFTLYNDYNTFANPSLMVNNHKLNIQGAFREQWSGFAGNPRSIFFNGSYYIDKAKSAVGVSLMYNALGAETSYYASANYAFDWQLGNHHIVPSVNLGMINRSLDGTQLNAIQGDDPSIPLTSTSGNVFDLGLGLAYLYEGLNVAFSTQHITEGDLNLESGASTTSYSVARHYYGLIAYDAHIGKYLRLKPVAFVKTDMASTQFDQFLWLGVRNLNKAFDGVSLGAGYRIDDAVMVGIEFNLKWFSLAYSYDITTSKLNNYSNGSHEVQLRFHLLKREDDSL